MPAGESEVRAKTRNRFNEVFNKYSESEKKKSKKNPEVQETIVLQTLKKNLEKDTEDDDTILQNTYHPEESSHRFIKNKQREKEKTQKINTDISRNQEDIPTLQGKNKRDLQFPTVLKNLSFTEKDTDAYKSEMSAEPDDIIGGKEVKRKSKKEKSKGEEVAKAVRRAGDTEDTLMYEYQNQIAQQEESAASQKVKLNNDVGKKKKKKLKSVVTESDGGDHEEDAEQDVNVENEAESKGKGKKKKRKQLIDDNREPETQMLPEPTFDDSLVLGVFIHRTDRLKTDFMISHPMVKIHVVDENTDQYVKKEDSLRPVSSFYEQDNIGHILPIMTQPFDFKKNKSVIPEWQEQIIFNERFGYFLQQNEESTKVILFFEILDFVTMEEARANIEVDTHERGFKKIAWAFLKLVGNDGSLNINTKLRLQLFCPPSRAKKSPKAVEVVEWWRKHPRIKYASTLFVTVKGIKLPEHVDPCVRSMMALQEERGHTSYSELQSDTTRRSLSQPQDVKLTASMWSRLPGQACRIPNKSVLSFCGGQMGCFTVRFSHTGTALAAACADRDAFPVVVYEIPSGKVLAAFSGHLKIVYDLCWSEDDHSLLSASSDGTVRMWNVEKLLGTSQKVLPHPSFVYCAQYHPRAQNLVVTGGYDGLLRVWRLDVDDVNGQLLQEFEGHCSFVNTVCFDLEGRRMFSADNKGLIIMWNTSVNGTKNKHPCHHWCIEKKIESDFRGTPINMLQLHPSGRSLLIHTKDSVLRMMDLRILATMKYVGATNFRERIYSTLTPCGNFIFSGSEEGMAYVWNTETGDQVAVYSELCYTTALHGVSFHPHENMVAFCSFGQSHPIHVYIYDRKVSQLHNLKEAAPSASADSRNTPDPLVNRETSLSSTAYQYATAARFALKMKYVKEKLDSVLEPHPQSSMSGYLSEQDKMSITPMGTRLTPDADTGGLNVSFAPLSLLSPFSKLQLSGSVTEHDAPRSSQLCGFNPVGQLQRGTPSFHLQTNVPEHMLSGFNAERDSTPEVVVSLHDYCANRSDELTLHRGDVIHVLYKDNDKWWFGRLTSGHQGYFLASYVADQREFKEVTQSVAVNSTLSQATVERATPIKAPAAVSSGEIRFVSEQDTDPETPDSKSKRKTKIKKPRILPPLSQATLSVPDVSPLSSSSSNSRKVRSTRRPLPKKPTGRTNSSFESEA